MKRFLLSLSALVLAGCVTTTQTPAPSAKPAPKAPPKVSATQADKNFRIVQARVEPIAERECRRRTKGLNCDFNIVVDKRANAPSNAYQTLDKKGRPQIIFTRKLIRDTRNQHELAFIMGHEAAHHIAGHIPKQQQTAVTGAILGTVLATVVGAGQSGVELGQQIGGSVGARAFSKDMELEADGLGTIITHKAGYNPRKGADFFFRIPDPGDRFLGSHPPNAQRRATVNKVASQL